MADEPSSGEAWFLRSRAPVLFPSHPALVLSSEAFDAFLREDLKHHRAADKPVATDKPLDGKRADASSDAAAAASADASPAADDPAADEEAKHPFVQGLLDMSETPPAPALDEASNRMLTDNGDVAYRSTENPLVDLFSELKDPVQGKRLVELLNAAWDKDSLATLQMVFQARSIHMGKSSRTAFYQAAGWLARNHPLTLMHNLRWLSRPVIQKKPPPPTAAQKAAAEDDAVLVETPMDDLVLVDATDAAGGDNDDDDDARFDVRNGVSHGYWKDLLNLLVLAARGKLNARTPPNSVLKVDRIRPGAAAKAETAEEAKARRHQTREAHHATAVRRFNTDAVYRALHLTVARLFAAQLRRDLAALRSGGAAARAHISLCGKWAPTAGHFHDKLTCVVSSIAELLHPAAEFASASASAAGVGAGDLPRETYLRHAREAYRRDVSALRAHLDVVERALSARAVGSVDYARVPSQAMRQYSAVFAAHDEARFLAFLTDAAAGKTRISGATLLPSTLVHEVSKIRPETDAAAAAHPRAKRDAIRRRVADAQWRTLIQRVRDSGQLVNSLAVCDVSASMMEPQRADGTSPLESAIGLSLVVSAAAAPPFRGLFISFSEKPAVHKVDVDASLSRQVHTLNSSPFGYNTDFVAVFERLLLPMAIEHKLKPEDMVRRLFVFTDMHFDAAQQGHERWDSSYERIQTLFRRAGYEMPELVFWDLAGNSGVTPKPVGGDVPGTALVSGYSQAMLKMFMEDGALEEAVAEDGQDAPQKPQMDPASFVAKAIEHRSYAMLEVVD